MDGMNGYTQSTGQPGSGTNGYGGNGGQPGAGMNGYMGYGQPGTGAGGWDQPMYGMPMYGVPSPEEEVRAARKHFSKLGLMFLAGTIVIFVVQIAASMIFLLKPEWTWNPNINLMVSMVPMYLIGMPVLILLVKQVPAQRVEKHSMRAGSFAVAAIMCFAIVYISNIAGNIMTWIIGALKGSLVQNEIANVATSVSIWMVLLYMVICAPFMEEYVFRKLIVDRTVRYGQGAAVLMSGLMFGLFHGNLNQFVYAFTLGMFLAFLYVKTGKLKITIALHMMINFVGGVVSTKLIDLIDLDEYISVVAEGGDISAMMSYMMDHLMGWIVYFLFILFVFGIMIAGGVLLIVFLVKKRFTLNRGTVVLPKGKRFSTMLLNAGMILYTVFWICMILWQMFGNDIMRLIRG